MTIRLATLEDLDSLLAITQNVVLQLRQAGIDQWDEIYPAREDFQNDIVQQHFFVLCLNENIVGGICFNEVQLVGYETADWQSESFLVVHRLLVDPHFQGRGCAGQLMLHAEEVANQQGKRSIRLDCFPQNPRAVKFYERLGYQCRGEAAFRKGKFLLYEKVLSSS